MKTLRSLRQMIEKLKSEKAKLLAELENLRVKGEIKAHSLEDEVAVLREETESLKKMLNITE
jgi:ubiquinone biosynthesis protein UbiJ